RHGGVGGGQPTWADVVFEYRSATGQSFVWRRAKRAVRGGAATAHTAARRIYRGGRNFSPNDVSALCPRGDGRVDHIFEYRNQVPWFGDGAGDWPGVRVFGTIVKVMAWPCVQ